MKPAENSYKNKDEDNLRAVLKKKKSLHRNFKSDEGE